MSQLRSVAMLNIVVLSVIILYVIMLNVVEPHRDKIPQLDIPFNRDCHLLFNKKHTLNCSLIV